MITFLGQVIIGIELKLNERRLKKLRTRHVVVYGAMAECNPPVSTRQPMNPTCLRTPEELKRKSLVDKYVNIAQDIRDIEARNRELCAASPTRHKPSRFAATP